MLTVEQTIAAVYGTEEKARKRLKVSPQGLCNWKARKQFPSRKLAQILTDAMSNGVPLSVRDVPLMERGVP